MLTDKLSVGLSLPEGEINRIGMLKNVCVCACVQYQHFQVCQACGSPILGGKNGENVSLDVQPM